MTCVKSRYWLSTLRGAVLDSWLCSVLDSVGLPYAAICHDADYDAGASAVKWPEVLVLWQYDGPTTERAVSYDLSALDLPLSGSGVTVTTERVPSLRGARARMCRPWEGSDSGEYTPADVVCGLGGSF